MNRARVISTALVTVGLATAMHLDWHVARPAVHHLSLGWRWHWLLAVPVFGLTARHVLRVWPGRIAGASVTILGVASILAAIVEPGWEYWIGGASLEWAFGRPRLVAFGTYLAAGTITYMALVGFAPAILRRWLTRRDPGRRAG